MTEQFPGEENVGVPHICQGNCHIDGVHWDKRDLTKPGKDMLGDGKRNFIAKYSRTKMDGTPSRFAKWANKLHWCWYCEFDCGELLILAHDGDRSFMTSYDSNHTQEHLCSKNPKKRANRLQRGELDWAAPEATIAYREAFSKRIADLEEKYLQLLNMIHAKAFQSDVATREDMNKVVNVIQRLTDWTHLPEKKEE